MPDVPEETEETAAGSDNDENNAATVMPPRTRNQRSTAKLSLVDSAILAHFQKRSEAKEDDDEELFYGKLK